MDTTPKTPLVPVTTAIDDDIRKVNDTTNRTVRTLTNSVSVGAIVAIINNRTGLDITAEEAIIAMIVLPGIVTYLRNLAEFRGWIPSTKKPGAEIAPPVNDQGTILGQVKP